MKTRLSQFSTFQKINLLLIIPVLLGTIYFFASFAGMISPRLLNHSPNSGTELQPVWGAMQIARGNQLYRDYINELPIIPLTYGSLTYGIPGFLNKIFQQTTYYPILYTGRFMAFFGFLLSLTATIFLAKRLTNSFLFGAAAIIPIFWFPYINEWATKYMPDYPAVALSLIGWWILSSGFGKLSVPRMLLAALSWVIVWHLKPIVLVGPIAFASETLYKYLEDKDRKYLLRAAIPYIITALIAGLTSLILNYQTGGLWKLNTIDTARQCHWNFRFIFQTYYIGPSVLWIPAPLLIGLVLIKRSPIALALVVETVMACIFMMKQGANINYLIGSILLFGILTTIIFKQLCTVSARAVNFCAFAAPVFLIIMGCINFKETARLSTEYSVDQSDNFLLVKEKLRTLDSKQFITTIPKYGLENDNDVLFVDFYHYALLVQNIPLSEKEIAKKIASKYDYLITEHNSFRYHDVFVDIRSLLTQFQGFGENSAKVQDIFILELNNAQSSESLP